MNLDTGTRVAACGVTECQIILIVHRRSGLLITLAHLETIWRILLQAMGHAMSFDGPLPPPRTRVGNARTCLPVTLEST